MNKQEGQQKIPKQSSIRRIIEEKPKGNDAGNGKLKPNQNLSGKPPNSM